MARKVFRSKVDGWLWLAMGAGALGVIGAMVAVVLQRESPVVVASVILISLLVLALFASVSFGTSYTVDRRVLIVRSGPFRWKVPLDEIASVETTRSPLSSPALSLDRIRIRYAKNRRILVSPADRKGFLKAIGQQLRE